MIDCISRQAAQDYIAKFLSQFLYDDVREAVETIDEYIGDMPSVTPTEQAGHWIEFELPINNYATSTRWKCNICDGRVEHISNYCPNCGCRMVEPQESEG